MIGQARVRAAAADADGTARQEGVRAGCEGKAHAVAQRRILDRYGIGQAGGQDGHCALALGKGGRRRVPGQAQIARHPRGLQGFLQCLPRRAFLSKGLILRAGQRKIARQELAAGALWTAKRGQRAIQRG